ncbi:MAG: hypothetical protein BAJATHORv1_10610 [Candidatus Thorarchaeota archaeon]|nr:MAG: hypothetical protein BAJATHORv1_10610 [Candidatus Thorarchaeota archaeon]
MDKKGRIFQTLQGILERYRSLEGGVDYFALIADTSIVEYADSLAEFNPDVLNSENERLAFWINCYNALSIAGVVKKLKKNPEYAEEGNSSWIQRVKFFALQKFNVGGKKYTLREIENHIRENFQEPRIHFALNCSSKGCPALKNGLYSSENLDSELDEATRLYLQSSKGLQLDKEKCILFLSMIFKWYKDDFEHDEVKIVDFILRYIDDEKREFITNHREDIDIKYIDYDWSLNLSTDSEGAK